MELGKLKYKGTMLLDVLLDDICTAVNPGAPTIFLGADWLNPK